MRIFNKDISKQDAGIKVTNAGSNESSINLPKEIADFLVGDAPGETPICVVLHKIDLLVISKSSHHAKDLNVVNILSKKSVNCLFCR